MRRFLIRDYWTRQVLGRLYGLTLADVTAQVGDAFNREPWTVTYQMDDGEDD